MRSTDAPLLSALCLLLAVPYVQAGDANRLTYLDDGVNPYYPKRDFARLTTPQWVGEEGVEAVVILAIDDMRDSKKYEEYLRPILNRLKKIDGRGPVSIMTCRCEPDDPQMQTWLKEGVSLEAHTWDHPCPLLGKFDLAGATETYDRCVDQLCKVPNNKPVAFRMPCCDSLNTLSPRFFAEIFNKTTAKGNFLQADSSVFNLPAEAGDRFRKYLPQDRGFYNTIEDYPYPYVIGRLCWEFPCAMPSDWQAQHLHKPNNPITVQDWKEYLDITVRKQGVMTMVFHPHGWIKNEQIVELIDYAVEKHGKKVKFLNFKEAVKRLNGKALQSNPLRNSETGRDNGVRLLDVNDDGYMDVVVANEIEQATYLWCVYEEGVRRYGFPFEVGERRRGRQRRAFRCASSGSIAHFPARKTREPLALSPRGNLGSHRNACRIASLAGRRQRPRRALARRCWEWSLSDHRQQRQGAEAPDL